MALTFHIKQNDTSPAIQITTRDSDGAIIDVTGATIRFHMRDSAGTVKVDGAGSIVDAVSGVVKYDWIAADTDTAGTFDAEFEVTYADTTIETFPNVGYVSIIITDDIA